LEPGAESAAPQPEISIIVPVYNTARFLRACLDSLVGQTKKAIEIICVNDGSSDNSLAVLEEYAAADARVIVIDQPYKGVSAARNAALQRASAPYIMSCDSDDFYAPNMCERLFDTLIEQQVDVVICAWNIIFEIPNELRQNVEDYLRLKYYGYQMITWQKILNTDVSLCNKIYKRSIIDEHGIDFPEGLLFEDAYFNDAYLTASKSIYYLHERLYNYIRHEASVMSQSYKRTGTAADYLQIAFRSYDYLQQNGLADKYCNFFWHRFNQYLSFTLDHLEGEAKAAAIALAKSFLDKHALAFAAADEQIKQHITSIVGGKRRLRGRIRNAAFGLYWRLRPSFRIMSYVDGQSLQLFEQQKQISDVLDSFERTEL
jgi:glycosyltransferase involved in cell wall biosynthesis